jgi:hypothetical protein
MYEHPWGSSWKVPGGDIEYRLENFVHGETMTSMRRSKDGKGVSNDHISKKRWPIEGDWCIKEQGKGYIGGG